MNKIISLWILFTAIIAPSLAWAERVVVDNDLIKIVEIDKEKDVYKYEIKNIPKFKLGAKLALVLNYKHIFTNARLNTRITVVRHLPCLNNTDFAKEFDRQTDAFIVNTDMLMAFLRFIYMNYSEADIKKMLDYSEIDMGKKFIAEFKSRRPDERGRLPLESDKNSPEQKLLASMIFSFNQKVVHQAPIFITEGQKLDQSFEDMRTKYLAPNGGCKRLITKD